MSGPSPGVLGVRYRAAVARRADRESMWRSLQEVLRPSALHYNDLQGSADARERRLLDSTGAEALEMFASFLMSEVFLAGTTDAAFQFVQANAAGRPFDPSRVPVAARRWMQDAALGVTAGLYNGRHNAVAALHNFCLDLGLYGSACLAVWESPGRDVYSPLRFRHYPVWQVAVEMVGGETGVVYIRESMSYRAALMRWPGAESVLAAFKGDDGPNAVVAVYACLRADDPELDAMVSPQARALERAWYGVWFLEDRGVVLEERGYTSCPVIFAPWYSVDNTPWGRSPGMTALGDVFMVNNMSDLTLRAVEKLVDPPMRVRDGALLSPLRLGPGGLTYTDSDDPHALTPMVAPGQSRIDLGNEMMRDRQRRIERAFFLPLFMNQPDPTGSKQPRTLGEVELEREERNRAVAPMILRMMAAAFEPMVIRVADVLMARGAIERPPADMENTRLLVLSNSPLVMALQQMRTAGLSRWLLSVGQAAQMMANPEILDWVDVDRAAALYHAAANAPADVLRDRADVQQMRQRRVEERQAAVAAETAATSATAAAELMTAASRAGLVGR